MCCRRSLSGWWGITVVTRAAVGLVEETDMMVPQVAVGLPSRWRCDGMAGCLRG